LEYGYGDVSTSPGTTLIKSGCILGFIVEKEESGNILPSWKENDYGVFPILVISRQPLFNEKG
jgi:hypothetical protein